MKKQRPTTITVDHDLQRAVPYLVARAGSRMGNAFSKALKPYGLSLSEWRVLASLGHAPHQRLSELATQACVDMSVLSRIVDRLIAQGFVSRERSADDGRAVQLALTEQGAELTREIVPLAQHYEAVALNCFSAAEAELLREWLIRLYDNAEPLDDFHVDAELTHSGKAP
ncbi:MarR family transcriptional regulator [Trinickia violacea]|uniref:MarR family transcriptional regulator n=1 Tax=Trinickia violacea TaxID=2571746 RepID=A0A4V1EI63_9BURK|nr:MarR family transcriptional regulator [Trinickia violacea]QCP52670.1 MarR family transcriptional regulator [Trinickia violacea]